jgi:diguanylate cyclase (GGDEF)-like protein
VRDKLSVLHSILDHSPAGIAIFDADLQLVAINHLLIGWLGFPMDMFEGGMPSLEQLTRFNAERGEYGPGDPGALTDERMALARLGLAHRFRRARPDGRTLEIIGEPLPGGGFLSIYTDVSDNQRVEAELRERSVHLQSVLDHLPQGISVFDQHLRLKSWNAHFLEVLQLPPEAVYPNVAFEDLIMLPAQRGEYGPGDPAEHVAQRRAMAQRFQPHRFERARPNGRSHLVEGRPMTLDGEVVGFVTSYTDVTEQKAVERELRQKSEVFQTLVDNIPGGVTLFGADWTLLAHNQEFARLLEFPDELFQGAPTLVDFFRFNAQRGEYGGGDVEATVTEFMARAQRREPHLFTRTRPNGTILEVRGLPLADGGFVTIYTDITERHRAAEAIQRLAHRDTLTGLANRYALEARLDQLVADARRHHRRLAVMFLDMDNFKTINDTLGHAVGDRFLCAAAARLVATVRDNDIVARLGGDEFVVVLADVVDSFAVTQVASVINQALLQPVSVGAHVLSASASIGICFFPEDGTSRGALMQSADMAMYHAKKAGKGRFHLYDAAMMVEANARLGRERALSEAVAHRAFELHYQPLMDQAGQCPVGVEALIRWRKPSGVLVSPLDFIPLAEEMGLIDQIGHWALNEACHTLAQWHRSGLSGLGVSVNVSALQLRDPGFPLQLQGVLQASGLLGAALTLEITESVAMEDPQSTVLRLEAIRHLGVRLAIDDFGTGYSSLSYLKRLPLDCLKLDRAFVEDLETDGNDAAICAATIALAHNLGLSLVAEGVETEGQHRYLAELGCDRQQGYWFSRPLPKDQAFAWLRARCGHPL